MFFYMTLGQDFHCECSQINLIVQLLYSLGVFETDQDQEKRVKSVKEKLKYLVYFRNVEKKFTHLYVTSNNKIKFFVRGMKIVWFDKLGYMQHIYFKPKQIV